MKKFLAVYLGSAEGMARWETLSAEERRDRQRRGFEAWEAWVSANAHALRDGGAPLGKTKRVDASGLSDTRNAMAAYTVVEAESHEAAARLFEGHPHFSIFPGEGVEIMECLPVPTR